VDGDIHKLCLHLQFYALGHRRAKPLSALASQLGWTPRYTQQVMAAARSRGANVCSSSGTPAGVWWGDAEQTRRTAYSLIRRGANTIRKGREMLAAEELPCQRKLVELMTTLEHELAALETNVTPEV